jgi:glycosyltransferase involved in cell wall biosynthesis
MVDAAIEWASRGKSCWFVTPLPIESFSSGSGRPTMAELVADSAEEVKLVAPSVTLAFERGTALGRSYWYASTLVTHVPAGVPVIVSDDDAVWEAASWCRNRNPLIGVLHADDQHYYRLARQYQHAAARLVAVSSRIADRAGQSLTRSRGGIAVVPCGVPLGPQPAPREDIGTRRLIWIGRIDEHQKRASDITRIALRMRAAGGDFTITVIGDGPARVDLLRSIELANLGECIRWLGWRSQGEVRRELERAHVLLSTSNFEGMPVAVMEALAAGCGIVATRVSGVEDYARDPRTEGCLWLYEVGDVDRAAELLLEVAHLSSAAVSQRARNLAADAFSIQRCMDSYEAVVTSLQPGSGRTPHLWHRRLASSASPLVALIRGARARVALARAQPQS